MKFPIARLTLLAAATAVSVSVPEPAAFAGMVDSRYDLQYYMDFARNKGMFSVGATNISVYYKDGSAVTNPVIPIMPNLDSYGKKAGTGNGGCALVNPQFVVGAAHVGSNPVYFLSENGSTSTCYTSAGYKSYATDVDVQRLNKIVTEVAYTPMADDSFMQTLAAGAWLYRLGDGMQYNSDGELVSSLTGSNTLGGIVGINSISKWANGTWVIVSNCRESDVSGDLRTPLDIGHMYGDSGSPHYAWDAENNRFVYIAACSNGTTNAGYNNSAELHSNPGKVQAGIDSFTVAASGFSGTETILWNTQDAATGKGTLTQGDVSVEYTGLGTGNTLNDTLGLTFSTTDTENVRTLELQGSVDMGAGAVTFDSGKWKLTEKDAASTFNSAGFVVNSGAELTLELTGTASEEWRKVGEGTMTIAGTGDNDAVLRVGGGETQYEITCDESGNITGCTLGNIGETRLNRTDGYAASSVRLEAGVAIVVLMADNQFKTNSVAGDTFTFGNNGGLLNLNGHDLTWDVINQDGSGTGARIGNKTPLGETAPGKASFTYTGTGTFAGCFVDEGTNSTAQLAVVYKNAEENATWTLTGNHSNVGGFTVEAGTMVLQGSNTPHVRMTDSGDWTYATLEGSDVTVKSGATFQLSHHALMTGNVIVEDGGAFILNQTVNAASESVGGSLRQDMAALGITSLRGNVTLNGNATMTANTESPVTTTMQGNITSTNTDSEAARFTKQGSGILVVNGQLNVPAGTVEAGGLVVKDSSENNWEKWTIGEEGFLAVEGLDNSTLLSSIDTSSSGVLALSQNQETQLDLSGYQNLIIGAWGDVIYGTNDVSLNTVNDETYGAVWRLGGGTGTLTVNFKLTGDADLLIGNEWSSGTVHLANTANDFSGDIYILGTGNKLSYVDGALGSARVNLTYGNALALNEVSQLGIIKDGSSGVLALATDGDLDLSETKLSLGANGAFTYTGNLTVGEKYRFGGYGQLTLDTALDGASVMEIDGQGTTGSSVIFARENAFTGSIIAGGGLALDEVNSSGDVGIRVGHESALAAAASVTLQKGAVLYTDGNSLTVNNLTMESGSALRNNGSTNSLVLLKVTEGTDTSLADGVLNSNADSAALHLVKSGQGTLTMGANANWSGGLTIAEGTVKASLASGGIGATGASIYVNKGATLSLSTSAVGYSNLSSTLLPQILTGSGTVSISNGSEMLLSTQSAGFEGEIIVSGNTRLYVTNGAQIETGVTKYYTSQAFDKATIVVEAGSQARLTSSIHSMSGSAVSSYADYVIAGSTYDGSASGLVQSQHDGALVIDHSSTVYGNVTLAENATISSWSHNPTSSLTYWGSYTYRCTNASSDQYANRYGVINKLGGTVRGKILGEGKTLTISGNEGMTFTADSENTYGDLVIANGNGNNDDKFALRLNGGTAVSQTSTALGKGSVTLGENLILRLAGTGTANNTDVVYTYENAITAGEGATLQSYNITNRLTGTVTMSGTTLNLATANGGVLELAGGIYGSGTLNVAANSAIVIGSASSAMSLARSSSATFSGTIATEAGADITLMSPAVVSETTTFSGTDSLTLRLSGTEDYTLAGITLTDSDTSDDSGSSLTLNFDFSNIPDANDASTYTTLNSNITADSTVVSLSLNMFNDIESGTYTLATGTLSGNFSLENTLNDRLSLTQDNGSLVLTVGKDNRLYWRGNVSKKWNTTDANWYQESSGGNVAFTDNAYVVLAAGGAENSTANSRETITLSEDQSVGTLCVKDETSFYEVTGTATLSGTDLAVGLGGNLKLSTTSASFSGGVLVNNASLEVSGTSLTANVTARNGSSFALSNNATLTGTLSISDAEATINSASVTGNISTSGTGSATLNNLTLTGEIIGENGARIITASAYNGTTATTEVAAKLSGSLNWGSEGENSLSLISGSLYLDGAVNLSELSVASELTVTVWNNTATAGLEKTLGTVKLGNNATLRSYDVAAVESSTTIGTLQLEGAAATLHDQHHSGMYTVNTLRLGDGVSTSTLTLRKNAASSYSSVFNLGDATSEAGNFAGTIVLNEANDGGKRSAFVILGNADIAQNAVISFADAQSATAHVGLGINIDNATIAGLQSVSGDASQVKIFSGTIGGKQEWHTEPTSLPSTVGDAVRTLTINTAADTTHNFYGEILGSLNLVKTGTGTQKLLGTSSNFNGSISVEAGTLALGSSSAVGALSGLTVSDGATLDLSGFGTDFSSGITLAQGATGTLESGATIAFGTLAEGTEYRIFTVSDGVLDGWTNLTASNFTISGTKLSDMGRTELSLGMSGTFSYTINHWDLVWAGGENGTWNKSDESWQTTRADSLTGETSTFTTSFVNNDNVTFNSNANLTISETLNVGTMTIADAASVSLTETGTLSAGSISVGTDATLTFATEKAGYSAANISGAGTVVLDLTNNHGNQLKLGAEFTGETHLSNGYFTITDAQVGSKLTLGNGTEYQTTDTAGTTVTADIVLTGATGVHANSGKSVIYSKSVTGDTYLSKGSSSHTFNGTVDLKAFNTEDVATVNFNAKTGIDTLTVDAVNNNNVGVKVNFANTTTVGTFSISNNTTTNFNGETAITTANVSGGTVNFNGETAITTATVSGGTVNFATESLNIETFKRVNGNVNFKLANGKNNTAYELKNITGIGGGSWSVEEGVSLTVNALNHGTASDVGGGGTLNVAGELNVKSALTLCYGWGESISGIGKINVAGNTQLTTWGTTNISVSELNISGNLGVGSYGTAHNLNLTAGTLSVGGTVTLSQNNGATALNISGGTLIMNGGATMQQGALNLSSGKLEQTGGTSTISNTFTMSGGELAISGGEMNISSATITGGTIRVSGGTLSLATAESTTFGGAAVSVSSGAVLQANAAITLSAASQSLTLVVGEAQVVPAVALLGTDSTGTALVTTGTDSGGKISVTGDSVVYIDVSALTGTQDLLSGDTVSLQLATESALNFNDANAKVGWWDESGTSWTDWSVANSYTYDTSSGLLTITIPEPSAFGLLAGLSALALCVSRRKRRK